MPESSADKWATSDFTYDANWRSSAMPTKTITMDGQDVTVPIGHTYSSSDE